MDALSLTEDQVGPVWRDYPMGTFMPTTISRTHPPLSRRYVPTEEWERPAASLFFALNVWQGNHPLENLPVLAYTTTTDLGVVLSPRPICTRALVDDARDGGVAGAEKCVVDPAWTLERLGPGARFTFVSLV